MESRIDPSKLEPKWTKTGESSWIVELEQDPETGEVVMPIPAEALLAQGWEIGDTLAWGYTDEGQLMLTKK